MKVEAILFGLILIGILFCLPNHSQACVGPPYFDPLGYPSEHPWQHNDSPGPEDNLDCPTVHIVILPINFSIKAIQLIQGINCTKRSSDRPSRLESDHVHKFHSCKKR